MKILRNLSLIVLLFISSCIQAREEQKVDLYKNRETNKYFLAISYSVPYEILVNDLVVSKDPKDGYSGAENLNLFLNTSGRQKIKIRVFAPDMDKGGKISPELLKSLKAGIYANDPSNADKKTLILPLDFPENKTAVPAFEYEWNFDNNLKVNYGSLENSKDLSKMDKQELDKMVLAKFNELKEILNAGDGKKFMKVIDKAKTDLFAAEYMPVTKQREYDANLSEYFDSHKGIMPEIQGYTLRLMGNGKAVALENTIRNRGLGVLTAEDKKDNSLNKNYFILHMPNGSDQLEVFRYSCAFTSLD